MYERDIKMNERDMILEWKAQLTIGHVCDLIEQVYKYRLHRGSIHILAVSPPKFLIAASRLDATGVRQHLLLLLDCLTIIELSPLEEERLIEWGMKQVQRQVLAEQVLVGDEEETGKGT